MVRYALIALLVALGVAASPVWAASRHLLIPRRGMTMKQVRADFGSPARTHPTVGRPPITRWDYPDFVVVFEYHIVQDAFVPAAPVRLYHRGQLRPVRTAPTRR